MPHGKERLKPLNEDPRHLDTGGSGNFAQDGYRRLARRPRTLMSNECMPVEKADRIEQFDREMREAMEAYED